MSTYEKKLPIGSLLAGADLSSNLHYLVKLTAADTIGLATSGSTAIGVLGNKPASGEVAEVLTGLVVPVVAGEAIAAMDKIAPDSTGRARTAVTDDFVCGIALDASAGAGQEFRCLMLSHAQSLSLDGHLTTVGVAATKTVTENKMVCLDADGYLVDAGDATAVSFWGISLDTVDNTTGGDGDLTARVSRWGIFALTGAGLAATDVGKEVWVGADSVTVTTTPGNIYVGIIDSIASATAPTVRYEALPIVGQRTDRQFEIAWTRVGTVGASAVVALENLEFPRKYKVLSGFADCETAPGGAWVCTIELDDGTTQFGLTITGAATHGENKTAGATAMLANTDTDVTLIDDNAAASTAAIKGVFLCEAL